MELVTPKCSGENEKEQSLTYHSSFNSLRSGIVPELARVIKHTIWASESHVQID